MVAADVGCDFCFVKVSAMSGSCRMFSYHCLLVLQSGVSDMFCNPGGDVTASLADVHLATGTQDLVNTQFLSWELSAFGGIESRSHSVDWFLCSVRVIFLQ
jgi:hypothetical protein